MLTRAFLASVFLVLCGCSAPAPRPDGGPMLAIVDAGTVDAGQEVDAGAPPDAGPTTTTLRAHRKIFHRLTTTDLAVDDPQLAAAELLVPGDGGFRSVPLVLTGDGGLEATELPFGELYLKIGTRYLVTEGRALNLDTHEHLGRPNLPAIAKGTVLKATLTGLNPTNDPLIQLIGAGTGFSALPTFVGAPFTTTTSLIDESMLLDGAVGSLPDGTPDDLVYVWQFGWVDTTLSNGTPMFLLPAQAASSASNSFLDGGMLGVDLSPLPEVQFSASVGVDTFVAHRAAVHPMAKIFNQTYLITPRLNPPGLPEVAAGRLGFLAAAIPKNSAFVGTLPLVIAYGNPLSAEWSKEFTSTITYGVPVLLPGTNTTDLRVSLSDTRPTSSATSSVSLRVAPPIGLHVDGVLASTGGTFQRLNPTVSWYPPAVGVPSGYVVSVFELTAAGTRTEFEVVAELVTTWREVVLPPGVLKPGGRYAILVTAKLTPGHDWAQEPFAGFSAVDRASADTISSIWSVP